MSRGLRYVVFFVGAALLGVLYVRGVHGMPSFGTTFHPYRDRAIAAAVAHATANAVSAVNFDQRGLDTLGEESIFFASVIGAASLLRPTERDRQQATPRFEGRVMPSTKFIGYVLLPLTLVVGFDVVAHGHVTPGGGFQGGVVVATGVHLLYVAGRYDALERVRPVALLESGEVIGSLLFAGLGFAGVALSGSFLANVIAKGSFGRFLSAGTVEILNVAVGIEVTCGVIVVLAHFFEQAIALRGAAGEEP
jgi:multicomponent Na+:H+ antiporter subunit B